MKKGNLFTPLRMQNFFLCNH